MASSPIQFSNTWKPGGTAILSTESITGRLKNFGTDQWGRWSYQSFQGRNNRVITIISAYQVVDKQYSCKGKYTAAAQQHTMLLRQADSTVDPRKAFRRDLTAFLTEEVNQGHEIILTGDFNERLGDDPSGMSKIAATFELIDIMHQQHPHLNDPATYARGSKRLDYALASTTVASAVTLCGYEPFNYRFHTDHRAYFIDFDNERLFGSHTQPLAAYSNRILHSNNLCQVTQYIRKKQQNWLNRETDTSSPND